jgi:hypothetical protein
LPASFHADRAVRTLAFELDYLDATLTAIGQEYAEDISPQQAHDLHSACDAVQHARAALSRLHHEPVASEAV